MQKIYSFARSRSGSGFRPMRAMMIIAFLFMASAAFAQVATYTFAQSVGVYTPIVGGTQHWFVPSGSGGSFDDNTILNVPIGFPFTYNGTVYNNVSICNNGYVKMGATVSGTNYAGLNGADNEIIAGHGRDLQCGWRTIATRTLGSMVLTAAGNTSGLNIGDNVNGTGIAAGTVVTAFDATTITMSAAATSTSAGATFTFGGEVRSQLVGSTFIIQYTKSRPFGATGNNARLDFQIRLNQTTNVIEVVYNNGIYSTTSATTTVGLRGLSNADFNNRTTGAPHDWNATTAGGAIAANITFDVAGGTPPVNGRTFTWTPVPPAACPAPFGLNATAITPTGATLNWNCTACAGPYNIEYGPTGFILGTGTIVNGVAASGYAVGGLPSSTGHQFYVTQDCTGGGNGLSLVGGPGAFTTSPANDVPCGAIPLVYGNNGPYSLTGYTATAGEVAPPAGSCTGQGVWCNSTVSNSAWYTFVAPPSGRIILQAQDFDTQLAIYSVGDCNIYGTFTMVHANDDDPTAAAHGGVTFSSYIPSDCILTPGATYYVQLDPYTANTATATDLILTDPGFPDSGFTGLAASYCNGSAAVTLTPNVAGGTFSGPGVVGNTFNPTAAGLGSHNITYTRAAPLACHSTTIPTSVVSCPGENPIDAIPVGLGVYGQSACSNISGNLTGHSASPGAMVVLPTGEDEWYKFVATTTGARLFIDSFFDVFIELHDNYGGLIATENAQAGNDETLNIGGLTVGETYILGIRAYNGVGSGAYSLCMNALGSTSCDYGPGPYTLCQTFKADFVNASQYIFHFYSPITTLTHTKNNGASTFCVLSSVPGLPWGDSYTVSIDAVWNLSDAAGNAEQIIVTTNNPCPITISAQPLAVVRPQDNCAMFGPHLLAQTILAEPFVCGAINWKWQFTRTDQPELPLLPHYKGNSSRTLQLSAVTGLTLGGTYDVMVAPVFSYGDGTYGAAVCVSIVGPGEMVEYNDGSDLEFSFAKLAEYGIDAAMYPNPNNGSMVNLNISGIESEMVTVEIMDMYGKMVYTNDFAVSGSLNEVLVFDEALASGVYNVLMIVDGKLITERLVVQK